jgi:hypothetical protein
MGSRTSSCLTMVIPWPRQLDIHHIRLYSLANEGCREHVIGARLNRRLRSRDRTEANFGSSLAGLYLLSEGASALHTRADLSLAAKMGRMFSECGVNTKLPPIIKENEPLCRSPKSKSFSVRQSGRSWQDIISMSWKNEIEVARAQAHRELMTWPWRSDTADSERSIRGVVLHTISDFRFPNKICSSHWVIFLWVASQC